MATKLSEDTIYGRELGITHIRNIARAIRRLGGASKLRSLSPEARNILLARINVRKVELSKSKQQ